MRFFVLLFLAMVLVGCASKTHKSYSTLANFKTAGNLVKGMTPNEAAKTIGMPSFAYFKEDRSVYYMVYPMADKDVSTWDLMLNKDLECLALNFEKENGYKFDGWQSTAAFTCQALKGEKADMSLVEQ